MSKKNNKDNSENDFQNVMESVSQMDSKQFMKTLEEERKKMLTLKKQYPNNPLFSQMTGEDFDISQGEFMDMCKMILTGNMSDTLSEAFNFIGGNVQTQDSEGNIEGNIEGSIPENGGKDNNKSNNNIEG